jgi:hypothetical protein
MEVINSTVLFERGYDLFRGCAIVGAILFVVVAVGRKYGGMAAAGRVDPRIRVMVLGRWILLVGAIVGLLIMALGS